MRHKQQPRSARRRRACVILAVATALPSGVQAADRFWITPTGGSFNSISNWSVTDGGAGGATVPGTADFARFTLANTYTVTFSAGV